MIAGAPVPQDGCLAHRRIGAHDTREGIKPRLVYEEEGVLLGFRPLLMAGQVSSRHRAMAASSRWRARRGGVFWGPPPGLAQTAGKRASWSAVSRRGAPGGGRWRRASGPPSRPRFIH